MIPDAYFDRFATQKYQSKNPLQRALIRRFVASLHDLFIEANPVSSVLEVGVGEGFLSGYLSEKFPEKRFTGVDLRAEDLVRVNALFPRIATHVGSAYDLSGVAPVDDGGFAPKPPAQPLHDGGFAPKPPAQPLHEGAPPPYDLVICAEVLEHLDEPARALDEILRLRPKRVLLSVPHEPLFMLSNLLRGKNVTRFGNDIEHVNHWGPRAFRGLLEARLTVLRLTTSYPWILALAAPR